MQTVSPESVGLSSERLARIDDVMSEFVKDDRLPGILTLIQRRGEIAQFGMYGKMDIETNRAMEADALFRIYSMTKPIASIALMMLLEEGKLSLYDPVAEYIPVFAKTKVYQSATNFGSQLVDQNPMVSIHHLMTHTAGLSYGFFFDHPVEEQYRQLSTKYRKRDIPLETYVEQIASLPLLSQPGTTWRYSVATDVVGYLVQLISGMPFETFITERILQPLGMNDTFFTVPDDKAHRLTQIYTSRSLYDPIALEPSEVYGVGDVTTSTQQATGGSGLVSTARDYLRFANCLLNQGELDGFRLIASRTLEWMTSDHLAPHMLPIAVGSPVGARFGLGFRVVKDLGESTTLASIGEFGWSGAAQTTFAVAPAEDMILMFMSQHLPNAPYPVQNRFRNLVYQAIME